MVRQSTSMTSKDQTRAAMERMEAERTARRQALADLKCQRADEEKRIRDAGNPGDVDFVGLVQRWRDYRVGIALPYNNDHNTVSKICISIRKRPINTKELSKKDHDSVTVVNPTVWVHVPKHRVDGINKYLDHSSFCFDYAFDEHSKTEDLYTYTTLPLVQNVVKGNGCRATVFAYGQTGSGKTHTMSGIQGMVAADLFSFLLGGLGFDSTQHQQSGQEKSASACTVHNTYVTVSFFEIYGVRIQDLLNNRHQLKILEDGRGEVVIFGLEEYEATNAEHLLSLIAQGNSKRTTHSTEANDTSSRSHSICQIMLRDQETKRLRGKLSLVDLAGSERGADTKSHDRQRQSESSEINKSLLALKECIRALDTSSAHVPYRASKLTLVLKDCFTSCRARTTMIATVSPASSSADHTLNTLRYADRVKQKKVVEDFTPKGIPNRKRAPSVAENQVVITTGEGGNQTCDLENNAVPQGYNVGSFESENNALFQGVNVSSLYDDESLTTKGEENSVSTYEIAPKDSDDIRFQKSQQLVYVEGEKLVNLHMSIIQEDANLLTEEGDWLQNIQKDDLLGDEIDEYASRLHSILDRKTHLVSLLQDKIESLRSLL